jgi:exodeoxyribonuclease-1
VYIFYDTEATGLDIDFTQLLQVAMVFADDDLNVLSSKKIECRRQPWVIPSPGAMLITGFTPDDLKKGKISHYSMMRDIAAWIKSQHWPLTFVGYNSLQFDEPAFERNLASSLQQRDITTAVSPHNTGRNRRFDIFPLVKQLLVYYPGLLKLDELNDYGKPALSLLSVARQNGVALSAEDAHDAMNDIRATLGVAQLIMNGAPELWHHALENMSSADAAARYMSATPVFGFTDLSYGRNATVAATDMGASPDGARRVIFDLSFDPAAYRAHSVDDIVRLLRRNFDRNGQNDLPLRLVRAGEQPAVNPIDLCKHTVKGYDAAAAKARAEALAADADFRDKVAKAIAVVHGPRPAFNNKGRPPMLEELFARPVDPAVQPRLEKWIADFHAAPDWQARAAMARRFAVDFADDIAQDPDLRRIGKYAGRIVFDNAPQALTAEEQRQLMTYIARRALDADPKAGWNTIPKARRELEQIERERGEGKQKWAHVTDTDIRAIKLYYTALEKELLPFLPQAPDAGASAPKDTGQKPPKFG